MQCIIFIGIQASGKSEFYKQTFYKSHIRLNLDMLKTRRRENILFNACLKAKQPVVIDNTNPRKIDREKYIKRSKQMGFNVIGYYFNSTFEDAVVRNERRSGKEKIPLAGLRNVAAKLELPDLKEGFDELYSVSIIGNGLFEVKDYINEI